MPFELRVQQVSEVPQEVGTLEAVRVKMLLLGDDAKCARGRRDRAPHCTAPCRTAHAPSSRLPSCPYLPTCTLRRRRSPGVVKVELTSENDLFFHYTHSLDEQGFRLVQEQQKLMVDFAEYPTVLIRMLNTCAQPGQRSCPPQTAAATSGAWPPPLGRSRSSPQAQAQAQAPRT